MKKKNKRTNKFALGKYFKDTYIASCVMPIIAGLLIAIALIVSGHSKKVLTLQAAIILSVLSTTVAILLISLFIFKTLKEIIKADKEKNIADCKKCSIDYTKYIFARHTLITLDDLLVRERELKNHPQSKECEVLNYTTLIDTFANGNDEQDTVRPIIEQNRQAGVHYYVVYLSQGFATERNKKIYGEENLRSCENQSIFRETQFDYLIHKTPENMYGYVAVNFISRTETCGNCGEKSSCDFENDFLVYRILQDREVKHIYNKIKSFFVEENINCEKE